jgi:hypothetical protein
MRILLLLLFLGSFIEDTFAGSGLSTIPALGSAIESFANSLLNVKQRTEAMNKNSKSQNANGSVQYNGNVQIPLNNGDPRNIMISPGQFNQQNYPYNNSQHQNAWPQQNPNVQQNYPYNNSQYPNSLQQQQKSFSTQPQYKNNASSYGRQPTTYQTQTKVNQGRQIPVYNTSQQKSVVYKR